MIVMVIKGDHNWIIMVVIMVITMLIKGAHNDDRNGD